jgi:hypothetical protein
LLRSEDPRCARPRNEATLIEPMIVVAIIGIPASLSFGYSAPSNSRIAWHCNAAGSTGAHTTGTLPVRPAPAECR